MKCPLISDRFIFADDAKLAAQLSCALSKPGFYLPVCDGPRMQRPDHRYEVMRRHNAVGRARANVVYLAGLPDESFGALTTSLAKRTNLVRQRISKPSDIAQLTRQPSEELVWGKDRSGYRPPSGPPCREGCHSACNIDPLSRGIGVQN